MNGNSVYASQYKVLGGSSMVTLENLESKPVFENRLFALTYLNKKSADYKNSRRFFKINWEKSFKELGGSKKAWIDKAIKERKQVLYNAKRSINFPTSESYTEAVEMGQESGAHDYILSVEADIEVLKGLEPKPARKPKAKTTTLTEGKEGLND